MEGTVFSNFLHNIAGGKEAITGDHLECVALTKKVHRDRNSIVTCISPPCSPSDFNNCMGLG